MANVGMGFGSFLMARPSKTIQVFKIPPDFQIVPDDPDNRITMMCKTDKNSPRSVDNFIDFDC